MILTSQDEFFPKFIFSAGYYILSHIFSAGYYILSHLGVAFVLVLLYGYRLVDFAVVSLLITYITNIITDDIVLAVVLVHIQNGLSGCLGIAAVYISESRLGHMKVIFLSAISFTMGLGMLLKSTINDSRIPLIIGMLLLAVGKAGLESLLETFLCYQLPKSNYDESSRIRTRIRVWKWVWKRVWRSVITYSAAAVAFVVANYYYNDQRAILLIATSLMSACILFLCTGISFYHHRELAGVGTGFSVFYRVSRAFVLQRIPEYPTSSNHPVDKDNDEDKIQLSSKIKRLRAPDKVAIKKPSTRSQEEQEKFGRLYITESEVQLVKRFINIIPMWTTILVVGLVQSIGDTYFPEQASNMEHSELLVSLIVLTRLSKRTSSFLLKLLFHSKYIPEAKKKTAVQAGIWAGIVSSILCSSVAWQVENRRATLPEKPMSISWLSPQFCLLGLTEGVVTTGLDEFTVDEFHGPWKEYVSQMNEFVIGLGNFLSIFFLQANKMLFGDTLGSSQLGDFYQRLTIVSFVNMVYFFIVIYVFYGSSYPDISGGSKCWMIPAATRVKYLEKEKRLTSSVPFQRYESIRRDNRHWKLLKTPTIRRRLLKSTE